MGKKLTKVEEIAKSTFLALPLGDSSTTAFATMGFSWPVAEDYGVSGDDKIVPDGTKGYGTPLNDPDLFSSLGRLSESGEPSGARILRWVKKYGLFTKSGKHNWGDPLELEEFREESRQAFTALTLFNALSLGNPEMIRHWIRTEREQDIDYLDRPKGPKGPFASAHLNTGQDDLDARYTVWREKDLTDNVVLSVGSSVLQARISEKVELELTFGANFEHPRPFGGSYRPAPVVLPRNLLAAAWLQLCLYVADFYREWRLCVACGRPFQVTRRDLTTCPGSKACQKSRQRKEESAPHTG